MGVRGLTSLLPTGRRRTLGANQPPGAGRSRLLLIDGNALMYWVNSLTQAPTLENPFPLLRTDALHEATALAAFIVMLRSLQVQPLILWDGLSCWEDAAHKEQTWQDRWQGKLANDMELQKYLETGELPKRRGQSSTVESIAGLLSIGVPGLSRLADWVLDRMAVQQHSCFGEADGPLVALLHDLRSRGQAVVGILSGDSDFAVYPGCTYLPLDSLLVGGQLLAQARDVATGILEGRLQATATVPMTHNCTGEGWEVSSAVLEPADVASSLGLPARLLVDLACLCGNDWTGDAVSTSKDRIAAVIGAGVIEGGPSRVSLWMQGALCMCEATVTGPACSACGKAVRLADHTEFSRCLQDRPDLATSFSYGRGMYEGQTSLESPLMLALAGPAALAGPRPVQPHEAQFASRLASSAWDKSIFACFALGILDSGDVSVLDRPLVRCGYCGSEPLPFDPRQANSALIQRPFRAVELAWLTPVTHGGMAVVEMVRDGALPGLVRVDAHPDTRLTAPFRALLQALAGTGALAGDNVPGPACTMGAVLLPLVPAKDRITLFRLSNGIALVSWQECWTDRPHPMQGPVAEVSVDALPMATGPAVSSPWLGDGADITQDRYDPLLAVMPLLHGQAPSSIDVDKMLRSCVTAVPALRHLIAVASHATPPSHMPTLAEIACICTMLVLLHLKNEGIVRGLRGIKHRHGRPLARACSIASWYVATVSRVQDLAVACGILTDVQDTPLLGMEGASQDSLLLAAGQSPGGASIMRAVRKAGQASHGPPASPISDLMSGPLWHALAEDCEDSGWPASCAPGSSPCPMPDGSVDGISILPGVARELLEHAGKGAMEAYRALTQAVFLPFSSSALVGAAISQLAARLPLPVPQAPIVPSAVDVGALEEDLLATSMAQLQVTEPKPGLPIAGFKRDIVWAIATSTVCIIKGDTGSGKSSQVPQYIYDCSQRAWAEASREQQAGAFEHRVPPDVWGDRRASIYVTQPRRLAAVTLARRVAEERSERLGQTVGYRIGQDAVAGPQTRIFFVTTGWLLTWLVHASTESSSRPGRDRDDGEAVDPLDLPNDVAGGRAGASPVTHIVLDETHERGIDTDLILLVVKMAITRGIRARVRAMQAVQDMAKARKGAGGAAGLDAKSLRQLALLAWRVYACRTRVVLMSATIDTGVFTEYFAQVIADHTERMLLRARLGMGGDEEQELLRLQIPDVLTECPPLEQEGYSTCPEEPSLLGLMEADSPRTLYVGAKRYPVDTVWLDEVYKHHTTRHMPKHEAVHVAAVQQKFDRAAAAWGTNRPGRPGKDVEQSVGDAVVLSEGDKGALMTLAARLALAVARPGTGDTILIFVAGMADIDALVETFTELAPSLVAAPTARMAVGEEVEEDADMRAAEDRVARAHRAVAHLPVTASEEEKEESEAEHASPAKAGPGSRPLAGKAKAATQDSSRIRLLPMHSLISFEDQMAAFESSKEDRRTKVVIATNIAETSVTLPDVHTVIDMGRAKSIEYVARLRTSLLRATWISQSSAAQRAGRAGRVCPGTCYRLYSRAFHDTVLPKYEVPEMLRLSLDSVVLKVKLLGVKGEQIDTGAEEDSDWAMEGQQDTGGQAHSGSMASAKAILSRCIQAPETSNVDVALARLASLGALDSAKDTAAVTPLGRSLASFPGNLELGKLVSFGALMGCLPDAIVLAAVLASQDVFLLPHAAISDSLYDYANVTTKVVRSRWLFGRDVTLGQVADDSMAQAWSEPIAARNAYIAWRAVHPKARPAWASGFGLMHRRLVGVHGLVREIAHRVGNDNPSLLPVLRGLARDMKPEAGEGEEEAMPSLQSSFTSNTHLLRVLLTCCHLHNLCVGGMVGGGTAETVLATGLDPARSLVLTLDAASGVPMEWMDTLEALESALGPAPAVTPTKGKQGKVGPSKPACALLRALDETGVPSSALSKAFVGAKGKGRKVANVKTAFLEFGPDWEHERRSATAALTPSKTQPNRYATVSVGGPLGSALSPAAAKVLGLRDEEGEATAAAGSAGPVPPALGVWSDALGRALPVHLQVLAMLAGTRGQLKLPYVPRDREEEQAEQQRTGVRTLVPGAVYVSGEVKPGSLPGLGGGAAGGAQSSRAALPSSITGGAAIAAGTPIELKASVPVGVAWATNGSLSGKGVFGKMEDGDDEDGGAGRGRAPSKYLARVHQHSTLRLMVPQLLLEDEDGEDVMAEGSGRSGKRAQKALAQAAKARDKARGLAGPLMAVCGTLQVQESVNNGRTSLSCGMLGATVLWRDPSVLALAFLLFGRGVMATLTWTLDGDGDPIVCRVVLDPRGQDFLSLAPCAITLPQLLEVNHLRGNFSTALGSARVAVSKEQAEDTQQRVLAVLGLGQQPVDWAGVPLPSCLSRVFSSPGYHDASVQDIPTARGWAGEDGDTVCTTLLQQYSVADPTDTWTFGCPAVTLTTGDVNGLGAVGAGAWPGYGTAGAGGKPKDTKEKKDKAPKRKVEPSAPASLATAPAGISLPSAPAAVSSSPLPEDCEDTANACLNTAKYRRKEAKAALFRAQTELDAAKDDLAHVEAEQGRALAKMRAAARQYRRMTVEGAIASSAAQEEQEDSEDSDSGGKTKTKSKAYVEATLVKRMLRWQVTRLSVSVARARVASMAGMVGLTDVACLQAEDSYATAGLVVEVAKAAKAKGKAKAVAKLQQATAALEQAQAQLAKQRAQVEQSAQGLQARAAAAQAAIKASNSDLSRHDIAGKGLRSMLKDARPALKALAGVAPGDAKGLAEAYGRLLQAEVDVEDTISEALHATAEA